MALKKEVSIYNFTTIKGLVWWRWGGADFILNSSQNREDVYEHVLDLFYQLFTSLEEHLRIFNPDNNPSLWSAPGLPFINTVQPALFQRCSALSWSENQSTQELWRRCRDQRWLLSWTLSTHCKKSSVCWEFQFNISWKRCVFFGSFIKCDICAYTCALLKPLNDAQTVCYIATGMSM